MGFAASNSPPTSPLDLRVRAELVRTAHEDSLYGALFAAGIVVLFGATLLPAFPARTVLVWAALALACNALRLTVRWRYFHALVLPEHMAGWAAWFVAISAVTGLSWGAAAWIFYDAVPPIACCSSSCSRVSPPVPRGSSSRFLRPTSPISTSRSSR
jgi:hypothetical protein